MSSVASFCPACQLVPHSGLLPLPLLLGQLFPMDPGGPSSPPKFQFLGHPLPEGPCSTSCPLDTYPCLTSPQFLFTCLCLPAGRPGPRRVPRLSRWQAFPSTEHRAWRSVPAWYMNQCRLPRARSCAWQNLPLNPGYLTPHASYMRAVPLTCWRVCNLKLSSICSGDRRVHFMPWSRDKSVQHCGFSTSYVTTFPRSGLCASQCPVCHAIPRFRAELRMALMP